MSRPTTILSAVCIVLLVICGLLGFGLFGCGNENHQDAFPSTYSKTDKSESLECQQFTNQIGDILNQGIAEDNTAEKRQTEEFDNLERNLAQSNASEEQKTIAINNLSTRHDAENEARENRQNNRVLAVQEQSRAAGCIAENK